jgi:tetratricopeptide (TPR) repeat protein
VRLLINVASLSFCRGYCAFGNKCRKWHPDRKKKTADREVVREDADVTAAVLLDREEHFQERELVFQEEEEVYWEEEQVVQEQEHVVQEQEHVVQEQEEEFRSQEEIVEVVEVEQGDVHESPDESVSVTSPGVTVVQDHGDGDDEDDEEADDFESLLGTPTAALTSSTKKSRLEQRREARKARKASRKKNIRQTFTEETPGEEVGAEAECNSPEVGTEVSPEVGTEVAPVMMETDTKEAVAAEECLDGAEIRVLTKKEKKKEERMIANALKKKEKQERKIKVETDQRSLETDQRSSLRSSLKGDAGELVAAGKHLEAAIAFTKAMGTVTTSKVDDEAELYAGRSECYMALDRIPNALTDARRAVGMRPNENDWLKKLLNLEVVSGNTKEALEILDRISSFDASTTRDLVRKIRKIEDSLERTEEFVCVEQWDRAVEALMPAEEASPHSHRMLLLKAEISAQLGRYTETAELVRAAQRNRASVDDPRLLYVRALELYHTDAFWRSEQKEPDVLKLLAKTRNWKERSKNTYQKAMAIKTRFKSVANYMRDDSDEDAVEVLQDLIKVDPSNKLFQSDAHCVIGSIHDDADEAVKYLTLSIKFVESSKAYTERGKVFKNQQRYEEAVNDFEAALRIDPTTSASSTKRLLNQCRRLLCDGHRRAMESVRGVDLYGLLGVCSTAPLEEIKKAFHSKAKEFHPDKHATAEDEERKAMESKMKSLSR